MQDSVATTCSLIRREVVDALQTWEPRIWNIQVECDREAGEGLLLIQVSYEVRQLGVAQRQSVSLPTG